MKSDFLRSEIESDITTRERNLTLIKTLPSRYPGFREEDKRTENAYLREILPRRRWRMVEDSN